MPRWLRVSGPRAFLDSADVADFEYGWAYEIERERERRPIGVYITSGLTVRNVPEECVRAIRTDGRSAIEAVLDRDQPPRYIELAQDGVREHG